MRELRAGFVKGTLHRMERRGPQIGERQRQFLDPGLAHGQAPRTMLPMLPMLRQIKRGFGPTWFQMGMT
jgi:hypothetical protein